MAVFPPDAAYSGDPVYRLMGNSPVVLFRAVPVLAEAVRMLTEHGWQIVRLDAALWRDVSGFHTAVASALDFPDYYGRNFNAFVDCLRDVVDQDYGWSASSEGLAMVFEHFDEFARSDAESAHAVLDILAGASWDAALFGRRLMVLAQSGDPWISFAGVGARPVVWNEAEWLNRNRID
ncbi:barstar family protein [Microbacterium sp. NPDC057650]|uniref:barstar family protein n=1 Tax=unclassified Microbacterium TaxID=2609290 RepID=UPI003672294B